MTQITLLALIPQIVYHFLNMYVPQEEALSTAALWTLSWGPVCWCTASYECFLPPDLTSSSVPTYAPTDVLPITVSDDKPDIALDTSEASQAYAVFPKPSFRPVRIIFVVAIAMAWL